MPIHPTAIVQPGAKIAESAEIGPYCLIGPKVSIGARTRILAHVFLDGDLEIGEDNVFFPYSTVGVASQDLKYRGEPSRTRIGHRNQIREFVTIHRGTEGGGMLTSIGDDNLLMTYVHVAHDTRIGSHVVVEDWGIVGASSGVHQFCRVGRHAFIGGYSVITRDVLPFSTTVTEREARVFGANVTGLT